MYSQALYFLIILPNALIEPENTRWTANIPINLSQSNIRCLK